MLHVSSDFRFHIILTKIESMQTHTVKLTERAKQLLKISIEGEEAWVNAKEKLKKSHLSVILGGFYGRILISLEITVSSQQSKPSHLK